MANITLLNIESEILTSLDFQDIDFSALKARRKYLILNTNIYTKYSMYPLKVHLFGSALTVNQATLEDELITLMFKSYIST